MSKAKTPKKTSKLQETIPLMASATASPTTRRNRAGSIERTDRYKNIEDGMIPFKYSTSYSDKSSLEIRDAVMLCQKAYYNFSVFRNVIDLMTEFSVSNIYYRGGNAKSREFFDALFNKINLWDLQDKFYREYYRSGNVFIYKFESELSTSEISKITQIFSKEKAQTQVLETDKSSLEKVALKKNMIPSRYTILNPADIQLVNRISFAYGNYSKVLSDYELDTLRNPRSDEDLEVFNSLPPEVQEQIKKKINTVVLLPLDKEKIVAIFYKKQDYEPFAVPMGFPVLEDINYKYELKKMDMAVSRTMQQAILLITMGAEPDKGGINQKNLAAMQELFKNESVGRVLIADYTTKAEFVVPKISELLDPRKYEVIDRDINMGLNNILVGGEKFANQESKVEVFLGRLRQGREAFVNGFLLPEIKKVAKSLGFKNFPIPFYEDFSLKDDTNSKRIYTRLIELGVLTAEEGLIAIETGRLPDKESSLLSQKDFAALKDEGLYVPLIGGPKVAEEAAGRPAGSNKIKQQTKKISPIGASFSSVKVRENMVQFQKVEDEVITSLKKKFKIKKLNEAQASIAEDIAKTVILNEEKNDWLSKVAEYVESPIDRNNERISRVLEIAAKHQTDTFLASILLASEA